MTHTGYNSLIRRAAVAQSQWFGIDTPRARRCQAYWVRRIRREYPFSQFGVTWGVGL
jgi:hypothetical protein